MLQSIYRDYRFPYFVGFTPFKVYFSENDVKMIEKFLKTDEGEKIAELPLRVIIRFMVTSYIKTHSKKN